MADGKFRQQRFQNRVPSFPGTFHNFQHGANIGLDRQAAKDRSFLGKIADAEARPPVHGQVGNILAVKMNRAVIAGDQPGDQIKAGGFAGAVGAQ